MLLFVFIRKLQGCLYSLLAIFSPSFSFFALERICTVTEDILLYICCVVHPKPYIWVWSCVHFFDFAL